MPGISVAPMPSITVAPEDVIGCEKRDDPRVICLIRLPWTRTSPE